MVQEVFLEAHRVQQTTSVRHWAGLLRRLAAYRALDRLRQRKPTASLNGLDLACSNGAPEAEAIGRELAERLRQAVAQLPEREAAVFCLRYFDDLSYDQIANHLDISRGAAATALHKARAKLQDLLAVAVKGE